MIIICPSCKKKFEVNENLIPDKGRILKCGLCNETWFYSNKDEKNEFKENIQIEENIDNNKVKIPLEKKNIFPKKNISIPDNKGSELVKYKSKSTFSFLRLLNYSIVLIITFVAMIILLDTFKDPLSIFFPNLELVLYNLFETLRDLTLFIKDLN